MPSGTYERKHIYPTKEQVLSILESKGTIARNTTVANCLLLKETVERNGAITKSWGWTKKKPLEQGRRFLHLASCTKMSYDEAIELGNKLNDMYKKGTSFETLRTWIRTYVNQSKEQKANSSEEANKYLNSYMRAIAWLVVHTPMDFLFDKNSIPPREVELICDSLQCDYEALCDDLRMAGAKPNNENNPWQ